MTHYFYPENFDTGAFDVPLGVNDSGDIITWNTTRNVNLIASNDILASHDIYSNIIGYCYDQPESWDVCYAGTRAGGFRIGSKTHTVLGVYRWSRKELVDALHLHIKTVISNSMNDSSSKNSAIKPVMFAIDRLSSLLWHLDASEIKKLEEIFSDGSKAGIRIYLATESISDSADEKIIEALMETIYKAKENLFLEQHAENNILNDNGKKKAFREYYSDYRVSPVSLIPKRLHLIRQ